MTPKELRKLKRTELIDLLTEQNAVIEELQLRVEKLEVQLQDKSIKIDQAGSLAEAAIEVNGVIEAAQKAAQQYLDNIESLNSRTTMLCMQQEEECNSKCRALEAETKERCAGMEAAAEQQIEARWEEFTRKVDQYVGVHGELKEILKATIAPLEK